jgi:hypothetical protein
MVVMEYSATALQMGQLSGRGVCAHLEICGFVSASYSPKAFQRVIPEGQQG